jgi:hypothetical protein
MINSPVQQNPADWQRGYDAAIAGKPQYPAPAGVDALSYFSGWVEGNSDLKLARQIVRLPPVQREIIYDMLRDE